MYKRSSFFIVQRVSCPHQSSCSISNQISFSNRLWTCQGFLSWLFSGLFFSMLWRWVYLFLCPQWIVVSLFSIEILWLSLLALLLFWQLWPFFCLFFLSWIFSCWVERMFLGWSQQPQLQCHHQILPCKPHPLLQFFSFYHWFPYLLDMHDVPGEHHP